MTKRQKLQHGFSLMEALVALAIALTVLTAAGMMVTRGLQVTEMVTLRAEMQQDGRAAMNSILKDLSLAGTGIPIGGVQLPTGGGASPSLLGCTAGKCYLKNNNFPGNHMYAVLPDANDANIQSGSADAITVAYVDNSISLGAALFINPAGSQIDLNSVNGLNIGDLVILTNVHGSAVGVITNINKAANSILCASPDPLNINQPGATNGNIAALKDPAPSITYPPTTVSRLSLVSYYLQQSAGPDGTMGTPDDRWQLMRQVGSFAATPVIDGVENLQFSYDIFDDTASNPGGTLNTNNKNANGAPSLVRKINVVISVRSPRKVGITKNFSRLTLAAAVSPRNLSFQDRYK
jgi:prepilin-type N-terminal cleavage/methylation domain-containing protein